MYGYAALAAALALWAILAPTARATRETIVTFRHGETRLARRAFVHRYYLDLVLLILGGLGSRSLSQSGTVLLAGRDIAHMSERESVEMRRRQVGFVFQSFGLLPQVSAYENVELILRLGGVPREERHDRAVECLTMVELE